MFVLGIDPGLTRCGYGALERTSQKDAPYRAVVAGVIETDPDERVDRRLGMLGAEIDGLLDELAPSVVVVERVFFQTNVRTAISVAQASGVILAAAARRGIEVSQFTPNEVKQAVVGAGGASKSQVQEMIVRLCGLSEVPRPPDVADALALAACHLTSERYRAAVEAASR
jgi:crossover junction endodeoxyribonuclease RuvC